jgi:hypothetical protein
VEPSELTDRTISPELVLVDPELAARARAALPERPWPPVPRITIEAAAPARVGRRRSFFIGYVLLGFAAVCAVIVLSVLPRPDRPTFAASPGEVRTRTAQRPAPVTRNPSRTRSLKRPVRRLKRPVRRRVAPAPPTRQRTTVPETVKAPARRTPPSPQPRRRRGPVSVPLKPGPSFAWPAIVGARAYEVLFLRNAKTFYKGQTAIPRIRLPARLRFTPGAYRWVVWPMVPSARGLQRRAPIVDSTFRVDRD